MLTVKRNVPPVDYSKANQIITVFHAEGLAGPSPVFSQRVINYAFFDFRKNQDVNRTGQTETNGFLLVIPRLKNGLLAQPIYPGDKVIIGEHSAVDTREKWAALIPSKVPNMAVVKYVDPKYWRAEIAHWEAGG